MSDDAILKHLQTIEFYIKEQNRLLQQILAAVNR